MTDTLFATPPTWPREAALLPPKKRPLQPGKVALRSASCECWLSTKEREMLFTMLEKLDGSRVDLGAVAMLLRYRLSKYGGLRKADKLYQSVMAISHMNDPCGGRPNAFANEHEDVARKTLKAALGVYMHAVSF